MKIEQGNMGEIMGSSNGKVTCNNDIIFWG